MNQIKNTVISAEPENTGQQAPKNHREKRVGLKWILDGSFLSRENIRKQFPFLVFLTFLGVVYIFSNNYADKIVIEINKTKKQLEELRFDYITTKAKLMQTSRQSQLVKILAPKGIREALEPPAKIER